MSKKQRNAERPAPAQPIYTARWQAAAWGILALAAISVGVLLYQANTPDAKAATMAANEARFAEIRGALPAHGVVGYISDMGGSDYSSNGPYFMAQYALAPTRLEPGVAHDLVVGNFSSPAAIDSALLAHRVTPVKDYGSGVLLLKGRP